MNHFQELNPAHLLFLDSTPQQLAKREPFASNLTSPCSAHRTAPAQKSQMLFPPPLMTHLDFDEVDEDLSACSSSFPLMPDTPNLNDCDVLSRGDVKTPRHYVQRTPRRHWNLQTPLSLSSSPFGGINTFTLEEQFEEAPQQAAGLNAPGEASSGSPSSNLSQQAKNTEERGDLASGATEETLPQEIVPQQKSDEESSPEQAEQISALEKAQQDPGACSLIRQKSSSKPILTLAQKHLEITKELKEVPSDLAISKRASRSKQSSTRYFTGFKRANDISYLHTGYDALEEQLKKVKGLGKACALNAKEKQKVWNQVSALKSRLKGREHSLHFESLSWRKDKMMGAIVESMTSISSRKQLESILEKVETRWAEVDAHYNDKCPVQIMTSGLYLKGKIRPHQTSEENQNEARASHRLAKKWPRSKVKGTNALLDNFTTPDYVFSYFQRNGEAEQD